MTIRLIDLTDEKTPEIDRTYELPDKGIVILGRNRTCDVIINDPMVSGRHCRVSRYNMNYRVGDLGSRNGTFVNGLRLEGPEEVNLRNGYRLSLGPHEFSVSVY